MDEVAGLLEEIFLMFASFVLAGYDVELIPMDEAAKEWIREHAFDLAKGVNQTTKDALRRELEEAWGEESVDQIARRIRGVYEQASRYRSYMIARTETTNAANMGSMAAAKRAGFQTKTWLTALDERTCPACAALHNVSIGIDEEFPGGYLAPTLHPNCRCTLYYPDELESEFN